MINILSYVGMNMQSEVCLWTLLGLVRTIFDATLFKVNANLKQVWQMTMPEELTMPVQRVLRTMISGVMLVQCFTVYVYLASYIVLLYPVFLEERPTLVLPWLLLAAIRKLLCELTSLALGLGTCVLLGPARPPCIKFVVVKFTSIMPAFYMWMLVFSYYHALKVASAFKTFPAVLPPNDNDYGLELAVRRRRTKSLLGEDQLRKKLVANFYGETASIANETYLRSALELSSRMVHATDTDLEVEEVPEPVDVSKPLTISTTGWSDIGAYEDWFGSEVMIPRDTDRILEQIVLMLLRIGAYLKKEGIECIQDSEILNSAVPASWHHRDTIDCATMNADDTDTPPLVGSSRGNMASYLREYPQIFMKKANTDIPASDRNLASLKTVINNVESDDSNTNKNRKRATPDNSNETISVNVENVASKKKIYISDSQHSSSEVESDKLLMPKQQKVKETAKNNEVKRQKPKNKDSETQSKINNNETTNKVKNGLQVYQITHENRNNESADATSSRISIQNSGDIKNQETTDLDPQIEYVMNKLRARLQESRETIRSINKEDTTDPTSSRILDQSASYRNRDGTDKDVKIESKTQSKDDINHILDKVNNSSHVDEISSNENRNDESTNATSSRGLDQQASNHDSDEIKNKQKNPSSNNKQT